MTDLIGQQLGNYRLIRLLGKGGSAQVYLGEHILLKRQAAIKVLHPMLKDEQKEDFWREAQRLVDVSHPSIISVFDFAIEGDLPYLIMEYAPHGTLRTRHPAGSRLELSTVVSYVNCVAAPLQYLHNQELVHCDVKPENLLVGKYQEILLSDLGIAVIAHKTGSLSEPGLAGTPSYMAPEQSEGAPRTASDQYALGIVVYEWLCGMVPFHSSSIVEILTQHLSAIPPSLCRQIPTLSPAVEHVILKALAKKPQHRYSTITEFAEALEEASQTTRTVAVVSPLEHLPPHSSLSDAPTVPPAEPIQKPGAEGHKGIPLRRTQPLPLFQEHFGERYDSAPAKNEILSHPVAVSVRASRSCSHKPYSKLPKKPAALLKRKALSYIIGVVPLITLILGVSLAGFAQYLTSHAAMTRPTASPTPVHQLSTEEPTAQPTQSHALVTDTFQRPDQNGWGQASDGQQWSVDANAQPFFSIKDSTGIIAGGQGPIDDVIGPPTDNVDVTVIGSINQFGNGVNFGVVLRWTDPNNWYKAYIDGSQLVILKSVNGHHTILKQMAVSTQAGVLQRLRFSALGTTLSVKVWPSNANQPQDWMLTVNDYTFTTGRFGIRVVEQPATVISIVSFSVAISSAANDA